VDASFSFSFKAVEVEEDDTSCRAERGTLSLARLVLLDGVRPLPWLVERASSRDMISNPELRPSMAAIIISFCVTDLVLDLRRCRLNDPRPSSAAAVGSGGGGRTYTRFPEIQYEGYRRRPMFCVLVHVSERWGEEQEATWIIMAADWNGPLTLMISPQPSMSSDETRTM